MILVTNDDGSGARGLSTLVKVARQKGEVIVISSMEPMSGMSHALTIKQPLRVRLVEEAEGYRRYLTNGTPADGVKLVFNSLSERKPDLLVSGINHGSNSSTSILYSGTMGAALEGTLNQVPSIGFSLLDHSPDADFSAAARYASEIMDAVLDQGLPDSVCLNVNVPAVAEKDIKGIRACRQARGFWKEEFDKRKDPYGSTYYWLTGSFYNRENGDEVEDTDEWALANGYVSVVPVQTDLTAYRMLKEMQEGRKGPLFSSNGQEDE